MRTLTLNAEEREITKKKVKTLRNKEILPAAIFGYKGNFNIQLNYKDFQKVYSEAGHTGVVDVNLSDKVHSVIISEVQVDPVTRTFIHVTLREVKMDEEITAQIPFVLVGSEDSPAVKHEQQLVILSVNEIELKGLPRALPQEISIDVSSFHAGDTILLKDIKLPEGITLVHDDEEALNEVIVTTASAVQEEIIENVQEAIEADAEAKMAEAAEGTEGAQAEGGERAADAKSDDKKE